MALFSRLNAARLLRRAKGKSDQAKAGLSPAQMVRVHIPNEREAGLRVWLIYSDIKKTTGAKSVLSLYRALSPFPSYLASAWLDSKRLLGRTLVYQRSGRAEPPCPRSAGRDAG